MKEKPLIHSREFHLIDREKICEAVTRLVDALQMAAGSTDGFDIYKVVEIYFTDLDKRQAMNRLLDIPEDCETYGEEIQEKIYEGKASAHPGSEEK